MEHGNDKYPAADLPEQEIVHDDETGEFDGPLRPEGDEPPFVAQEHFEQQRPEQPMPAGQAIIPEGHDQAADGSVMRTTAHTGGQFIDFMENGRFSGDVQMALRKVAADMATVHDMTGKKAKGRVTLVIDLEKEGEHMSVMGKITHKSPELPRPKSVVWQDPGGNFTRFPPNQTQMFGLRPAVRNPS